jgi:aminopeptidase N
VDQTLTDAVVAHETAHQWWGDLVTWSGYRDQWLFEALANYSSVMLLESKDPVRFREVMAKYRDDLLAKNKAGEPLREAGPVTLGSRLISSHFPDGYESISYGRGTWLLHMLRTMLRDGGPSDAAHSKGPEPFVRMLHRIRDQYAGKAMTTEQLLRECAQDLPPSLRYEGVKSLDWFYEGWVKGTAVPVLQLQGVKIKVNEKKNGAVVSGVILQKEAPQDLVTSVPLYAVVGTRNVLLGRVFADGPETSFHMNVPAGTRKLVIDPEQTLLARVR